MSMTNEQAHVINSILKCIKEFSEAELRAVLFVAKRLEQGRKKYGPLAPLDGRVWRRELGEELADALVYLSADAQRAKMTDSHSVMLPTTPEGHPATLPTVGG